MMTFYNTHVKVTKEQAICIEERTRLQGVGDDLAANLWIAERKKRITSSTSGKIAKRRSTTKVGNMVKSLLYNQFRGNAATNWGKEQEPITQEKYVQHMRQQGNTQLTVQPSGLVIHPVHSWLAASPDGLVNDPCVQNPFGLVEYKNPYSHRDSTLQTAAQTKDFCLKANPQNGELTLKTTHDYYHQIQIAMYCAEKSWCDFVVSTNVSLHVERIARDTDFIRGKVVPKLKSFYFTALLPELALARRYTGGIRDPNEWLLDAGSWNKQTETLIVVVVYCCIHEHDHMFSLRNNFSNNRIIK